MAVMRIASCNDVAPTATARLVRPAHLTRSFTDY